MKKSIHGHKVIEMMLKSNREYNLAELLEEIHLAFGTNAFFHTCSNSNMTAEELVSFLREKGKFIDTENGFKINRDLICHH